LLLDRISPELVVPGFRFIDGKTVENPTTVTPTKKIFQQPDIYFKLAVAFIYLKILPGFIAALPCFFYGCKTGAKKGIGIKRSTSFTNFVAIKEALEICPTKIHATIDC